MEQRYDAVVAAIRDGFGVSEPARRFGVSRQSLCRWMARSEEGGLEVLAEGSRRPKHIPHQMPGEIAMRVLELRGTHPLWGPLRIEHQLRRDGLDPAASHMAVYHALVLERAPTKRREYHSRDPLHRIRTPRCKQ
ncbi:MAG: helix-turn-helix domain-containing protein [Acidimicrobiales bacterium]